MDRHSEPFRVRARAGVILAAGGFVFDRELVSQHAPLYMNCLPLGTAGDDGAGIRLGESAGGITACMERMSAWSFYVPPDVLMQGVLVSREGERICNEELYGATQGNSIADCGGEAYLIFDSRTYHQAIRALREQAAHFHLLYMLPTLLLSRKKAASPAALAEKLGVPAVRLEATLSDYNMAAAGDRADPLGKSRKRLVPQDQPPFYSIDCSLDSSGGLPCSTMTLGGLVVSVETGQVKRADGSLIEGLYAAGRNAVGVCSRSYVSGLSIADCVFSGRRAGRHAAMALSSGQNSADEGSAGAWCNRRHGAPDAPPDHVQPVCRMGRHVPGNGHPRFRRL
jgi:3-oxo-5alpha-steroid 4-dehydrogenase